MKPSAPEQVIANFLAEWDHLEPFVELDTFGTEKPEEIVGLTNAFCRAYLGATIDRSFFYTSSIGSAHGVQLANGQRVVIKVLPPQETNEDMNLGLPALTVIRQIRDWLRSRGYPTPEVLVGPEPLARGIAMVEELVDRGHQVDGFTPEGRRGLACGLCELIDLLRGLDDRIDLSQLRSFDPGAALYARPHSRIFDFDRTQIGAEWIDDFARRARALDVDRSAKVLGHSDWRVEHVRFENDEVVAVFDWDSLAFKREAQIVGGAAHGYVTDWSSHSRRHIPNAEEIIAFVNDYEHFRDTPFQGHERASVFANAVYAIAYGARCAHSLSPDQQNWPEDTWPHLLRTEGEVLLKLAGG